MQHQRNGKQVDMLSLANVTRKNWRNSQRRTVEKLFHRWQNAYAAGELQPAPELQPLDALRAATLAHRVSVTSVAWCVSRWRARTVSQMERMALVDLYFPHAMRKRCAACFGQLFHDAQLTARVAQANRRAALVRGMSYWSGKYMRHRRRDALLHQLAYVANASSSTSSYVAMRVEVLASWRKHVASIQLARGNSRLGALMAEGVGLRRGLSSWTHHTLVALNYAYKCVVGDRACAVGRLRRGFTRLVRILLASRRGAVDDMRLLESIGPKGEPKDRYAALLDRATRRRQRLGLCALMTELRRAHALEWAALHASTRGLEHMLHEALRRWTASVSADGNSRVCGATARLMRVYRRAQQRARVSVAPDTEMGMARLLSHSTLCSASVSMVEIMEIDVRCGVI